MLKINDYVVYKRDVCKLIDIKKTYFNNADYYILAPIFDNSLTIEIPTTDQGENLRALISKEEIDNIINGIPDIEIIENDNRLIEKDYKILLNSGKHIDLVKIIKTAYKRNKNRIDNKKKIGSMDNNYFRLAERYLYQEFSIVLDMDYDDTKKYVIDEVNKQRD